ncbi:HoxN/HupN/NixA family nickel/cobalt transporter [Mariniblastus fucicola]|uniref:Nickel/cobalt efflux system RcnA n=1 Tax=Mariniblastus fucicola TaxID=980251 RepID=A0A5B9PC60_9BACT|nr:sulfite exporter TauE/SafE family protein [Mariniblastus fucicola]QEG22640.1 Nickel/cobalt efflux system RcnA [Mariniblastus fucicola]
MHSHEITLGLAFGLGALHALEPGHGKTAMLLYLAGERRSLLHPLVMGLSSALSHSLSLIGIAAIVHLTHHLVTGDHHHADEGVTDVMRWVSAGIVLIVGLWMCWSAWRSKPAQCGCSQHKHECHNPDEAQSNSTKTSYSMSALLGAAFGLMPCPSAMAAYFSGLSSGSPVTAYIVIGLFAAGIATSLTLVGMVVQLFGNRFTNTSSRLSRLPWNYIRAGLITLIRLVYLGHVALY